MSSAPATSRPPADNRGRRHGSGRIAALYLFPGMLGFLVFIVAPLIGSAGISLYDWTLFGGGDFVGLENYRVILTQDPIFWIALRNTVLFALAYTIMNLVVALGLAYWLMHLGPRFSAVFRVLFFIPVVTPMIGNALVFRLLLNDDGVVNATLAGIGIQGPSWLNDPQWALFSLILMSLWQGIGYNIIVLSAGLSALNPSVLEASHLDGAGIGGRFFRVILPMISPSVFFCTVMTVISSFKIFAQPYALTEGGPGNSTNTIVLYLYRNGFSYDRLGYASALAWVLFVLVILVTLLQFSQQKRLVSYDN
ncbi:MAG: sugar ABC transporter permease [Brachybacterium sp.]|nr:sugar ABC transporter permease [Brachybacterium sp.]